MATAITAATYYISYAAFRASIDAILLVHGVVDLTLAGHLTNMLNKQYMDKLDLAAAASAV